MSHYFCIDKSKNSINKNINHNPGGLLLIAFCCISFVSSLFLYTPVMKHHHLFFILPFLPKFNITFHVDAASMGLVIMTCFIWLVVSIFSKSYLNVEKDTAHKLRYNIANASCLVATTGAFMAGDFLTFYIFFESILFLLYLMIVHREDRKSLRSSTLYLYFGLATGLCLLCGLLILYSLCGTLEIKSATLLLNGYKPWIQYVVASLLIIGLGGKAGVFLEHIWMPPSYECSPCMTAALSSGIMIEVGAYGIFRVVNMVFAPLSGNISLFTISTNCGFWLIFLGSITMLLGALNALIAYNALKLLAYSSISQMGYIILGIGCAAYGGTHGSLAFAGAYYHIINHALFKVALFLGIGAVFYKTNEIDIRKLGGLGKTLPIVSTVMFISLCAISGVPGFNGFASKSMLHHALADVIAMHPESFFFHIVEIIFTVTAGCTFAYNVKLFSAIFLGKQNPKYKQLTSSPLLIKASLSILAAMIIFMGIKPHWFLHKFILPILPGFGYTSLTTHHLFFTIHNLMSSSSVLLLGGGILILGLSFGLFRVQIPKKLHISTYYRWIFEQLILSCREIYKKDKKMTSIIFELMDNKSIFSIITSLDNIFNSLIDRFIFNKILWGTLFETHEDLFAMKLWQKFSVWENKYDLGLERGVSNITNKNSQLFTFCQKISSIHSGDINTYISWIIVYVTIIIMFLVGIPYFKSSYKVLIAVIILPVISLWLVMSLFGKK
ncbi:MAG: complex I subunit 5 family protein [bacterium]